MINLNSRLTKIEEKLKSKEVNLHNMVKVVYENEEGEYFDSQTKEKLSQITVDDLNQNGLLIVMPYELITKYDI